MLVRPATSADVDAIVALGERMHEESAYAFLPYEREKVRGVIQRFIDQPETEFGRVAESGGRVVAMFGGYLTRYFFCHETLACDMVLFVDPEFRGGTAAARLIRAFRDWARERGAREVALGTSTNVHPEATGRFYEKMGLDWVGGLYKQRLEATT